MQKEMTVYLSPAQAANDEEIRMTIAGQESMAAGRISGFRKIKQSIDARGKTASVRLQLLVFIDEPFVERPLQHFEWKDVTNAGHTVFIAGAGPAGLFAALRLLEAGIRPIILERGKDVRARRRDLAIMNKEGQVNPESNYCFGEGGAGTYSDGKLYTRSNKRGNLNRILHLLVHFGATDQILYEAHPHIGTNKLPQIITAIREHIEACGGKILFNTKLSGFSIEKNTLTSLQTAAGDQYPCRHLVLATGHSARDIFELLYDSHIQIESKPFALGVRVEHPQTLVDKMQYHCSPRDPNLPPASYSVVEQVQGSGVFSFCMCPGGIIAAAATAPGEIVVNGWSPSKRNNPYANSGIVVATDPVKMMQYLKKYAPDRFRSTGGDLRHPLLGLYFQQTVEQQAYAAGGGKLKAPAQALSDFVNGKISTHLPDCSYLPGVQSAALNKVLPDFVYQSLRTAFKAFDKKMKGYLSNEAIALATESRTSSPVRIPREANSLQHPQIQGLYPCGEGAGYAGGIISAAMDGEKVAEAIINSLS